MIFHHAFQLEHNPQWTRMALERVGDPGGPLDDLEEVTDVELGWSVPLALPLASTDARTGSSKGFNTPASTCLRTSPPLPPPHPTDSPTAPNADSPNSPPTSPNYPLSPLQPTSETVRPLS